MTTRIKNDLLRYWCKSVVMSAVSVFAVLAATAVQAAEWRIEPLIRAAADIDDNAILTTRTDADADISGYLLEAGAEIAYASETTDFFVAPRLLRRDYGDPVFDSDDQFMRFNFNHDTQSSNFRLRGEYRREAVRTAERADADLEIDDPVDIPDDDTGRVNIGGRRDKIQVTPSWTYRVSNISSISVGLDYTDAQYDDVFSGLLSDFTDARANLSYQRALSPQNTAILTGSYRQFESDGRDDVTSAAFNAGFSRTLSETTQLLAVVGLEDTDQGMIGSEVNWVADISLTRRLQTITMLAQYRRTISGGGAGFMSVRDSINVNFTRQLSERISAGLGVRAYQTEALIDIIAPFDEIDYIQLRSQFTWHLTKTLSLEANYRYTFIDRSLLAESANSNNVTIWLNYRPSPIVRSR